MYPEGRVFDARCVMKVYEVPALIAAKAAVKVVPLRIRYRRGWRTRVLIRDSMRRSGSGERAVGFAMRATREASGELQQVLEDAAFNERPRVTLFEAFLDAVCEQGRRTLDHRGYERAGALVRSDVLKGALRSGAGPRGAARRAKMSVCCCPMLISDGMHCAWLAAFGRVPAMLNYSRRAAARCKALALPRVCAQSSRRARSSNRRSLAAVVNCDRRSAADLSGRSAQAHVGWRDKLWLVCFAQWLAAQGRSRRAAAMDRRLSCSPPDPKHSPRVWC